MVIDVGAVYDHSIRRYDHHQRGFVSTLKEEHPDVPPDARPDCSTKLSACGLVYKHYGLQELLPVLTASLGVPSTLLPVLYRKMYRGFVEEVDAIDNGIEIAEGDLKYKISTSLSARVGQVRALMPKPHRERVGSEKFAASAEPCLHIPTRS